MTERGLNMEKEKRIILVAGATGNQGGATARHLLADGWHVRALVRDVSSEPARTLAQAGAEVVTGNLDDIASINAALRDAYGVFSVQRTEHPGQADFTVDDEVRQGTSLADAAKAAGVTHFIYTSVGGAERNSGITQFMSEWKIEKHIQVLGLPATILRPVSFMENFLAPQYGIQTGIISYFFAPDAVTQLIAVDDIGAFAALAFRDPREYVGQALELAGDSVTMAQIAAAFGRTLQRPVSYAEYPLEIIRQTQPALANLVEAALRFRERGGYLADILDLRRRLPSLKSLDQWLESEGGTKLRATGKGTPRLGHVQ